MRAYHPQRQRPYPTVPTAVGRLPINLLRTALYPGRQQMVGNAIEAWQSYMAGAPQPVLLPQRMAFQQWKTTPSQLRKYWASSAGAYMALSDQFYRKSGVPTRVATKLQAGHHHPPYQPMYQAGLDHGGARMPVPGRAAPVLLRSLPLQPTRDVLAGNNHIAAPFPQADRFIETHQARAARAVWNKIQRRNAAEASARYAVVERRGVAR